MRSMLLPCLAVCSLATAQNWTQLPDFPGIERDDASAFAIGTDIYVGTGMDAGFQVTNDWYRFNTLTNTWDPVASLPAAGRQYASTFVIDGKGYLFGGTVAGTATNELWRFDPSSGTWEERATNADSAFASTAFTLDGTGHVVSGNLSNGLPSNVHWVYDAAVDTWTMATPLPGPPLHRAASFVHDGNAYVCGGSVVNLSAVAASYAYLPMNADWETRAPLPVPRFSADAVGVPDGGVLVCGGTYEPPSVAHNDVWHYIAATDTWEAYPPLPVGTRRGGVIAFVPPNKVYYGTGSDNAVRYKDWWMLELPVYVEDAAAMVGLQLSPVPANTVLRIRADRPCDATGWSISDACGRLVAQQRTRAATLELDVADLPEGAYVLHATFAGRPVTARFLVAH